MGIFFFFPPLSKLLHRSVTAKQTAAICRDNVLLAGRRGGVESALRRALSCRAGCSDERQLNQSCLREGRWFFFFFFCFWVWFCFFFFLHTPVFVTGDSPRLPARPTPHPPSKEPPPSPLLKGNSRDGLCAQKPRAITCIL